jgi:L-threonylcarbamoyladenylate synthase
MKTEIIPVSEIKQTLEVLQNGRLVAFPTDTVYGLGALAFNNMAIESIYSAKDRPIEKAIPVLISDMDALDLIAESIPDMVRILASRFWPGPLTCVVPKKQSLPIALSATSTVAVRVPDHKDARALLHMAGPMAVTSANISGQSSPCTAQEVYEQLNGRIPLILDGGRTPGGIPSTIVDCTENKPKILRDGPISLQDLLSALV